MPLYPPKRTAAGYFLSLQPPVVTPEIRWSAEGRWVDPSATDTTWITWAQEQRAALLGELLGHGNWFSRPPRRDILEPLFGLWITRTMNGGFRFACKFPDVPGGGDSGKATLRLDGLLMSSLSIDPVWSIATATPDESLDRISLFGGDDETDSIVGPWTLDSTGANSGKGLQLDSGVREIQLDDIEDASGDALVGMGSGPTYLRSREWEARKFLAKERVRETRLKAQVARHIAAREEARYYRQFGDLEDGESHFSDYDLSDTETESGSTTDADSLAGGDE